MSNRQTILLVEDDPDLLRFADVTLRLGGYRVYTATDGLSALSAARKVRPAIMLLDLRLPGLDGWQVLAVMAEDPVLRDLPVIVVTATADAGSRPLTEAAGVTEYLVKPLSADALLAAVERVLTGRASVSRSAVPESPSRVCRVVGVGRQCYNSGAVGGTARRAGLGPACLFPFCSCESPACAGAGRGHTRREGEGHCANTS